MYDFLKFNLYKLLVQYLSYNNVMFILVFLCLQMTLSCFCLLSHAQYVYNVSDIETEKKKVVRIKISSLISQGNDVLLLFVF